VAFLAFFSKEGCYIVLGRQMVGKSSMFLQSSVSSRSSVFVYNCVVFSKVWLCPPGGVRRKPANSHSSLLVVGRGWPPR
jgi:hypothetical protein